MATRFSICVSNEQNAQAGVFHSIKPFYMKPYQWRYLLLCLYLVLGINVFSQSDTNEQFIKAFTHQIYGISPFQVSGEFYTPNHIIQNGNPWLTTANWQQGTLFIRQFTFPDQLLRYDIEADKMILNMAVSGGRHINIVLNSTLLDSCIIENTPFINTKFIADNLVNNNYVAIPFRGEDTLIVAFNKRYLATYYNHPPYGKYTPTLRKVILITENKQWDVTRKKALLSFFSPNKKAIRKFMRQHQINYKQASMKQLSVVMQFCESLKKQSHE